MKKTNIKNSIEWHLNVLLLLTSIGAQCANEEMMLRDDTDQKNSQKLHQEEQNQEKLRQQMEKHQYALQMDRIAHDDDKQAKARQEDTHDTNDDLGSVFYDSHPTTINPDDYSHTDENQSEDQNFTFHEPDWQENHNAISPERQEEIKNIEPTDIPMLNSINDPQENIANWTPAELKLLQPAQVSALTARQIFDLYNNGKINNLYLNELNPQELANIFNYQLDGPHWTDTMVHQLTKAQAIEILYSQHFTQYFSPHQIDLINDIANDEVSIPLSNNSSQHTFSDDTTVNPERQKEIRSMSPPEIKDLSYEIDNWSTPELKLLSPLQTEALTGDQLVSLQASGRISALDIKNISPHELASIFQYHLIGKPWTDQMIAQLTHLQLDAMVIKKHYREYFSPEQIDWLRKNNPLIIFHDTKEEDDEYNDELKKEKHKEEPTLIAS